MKVSKENDEKGVRGNNKNNNDKIEGRRIQRNTGFKARSGNARSARPLKAGIEWAKHV